MRGSIQLPLNHRAYFTVYGGAFRVAPEHMFRVCMAKESPYRTYAHVVVPVSDFSVPTQAQIDRALRDTVPAILAGKPVYVGCGAGQGRTGLMLALLAKVFADPAFEGKGVIDKVRSEYLPQAVETPPQERFVAAYAVPEDVRAMVARARRRYGWRFWRQGNQTGG